LFLSGVLGLPVPPIILFDISFPRTHRKLLYEEVLGSVWLPPRNYQIELGGELLLLSSYLGELCSVDRYTL
jgi:hypothetical protein